MDEKALIQEILHSMLEQTPNTHSSRIRVVNLSVYDTAIDPLELTRAFELLTSNTIAQGAHLHVRRGDYTLKDSTVDAYAVCNMIRLDSFEMENPSIHTA
jgi:Zn finger protein HypA/HybF involved in hydrogenase expression